MNIPGRALLSKFWLAVIIILLATLSFGLGRLSVAGERGSVRIEYNPEISSSQFPILSENLLKTENSKIENSSNVVGSKNSDKYHFTHCPGAKQIAEKNRVIFASTALAEAAGYKLAANCRPN